MLPHSVVEACGCSELLPSNSLGGATASLHAAQSPSWPWSQYSIRHGVLPVSGPQGLPPELAQGGLCTLMSPDVAADFLGLPRPAMGEGDAGPAPPTFLLLLQWIHFLPCQTDLCVEEPSDTTTHQPSASCVGCC